MVKETEILKSMFESYLYSNGKSPLYGIDIVSFDNSNSIFARLTFKEDETYCCSELTCHFKPNWDRIRDIAKANGLVLSKPLSIRFDVMIEAGANIKTNLALGLPLKGKPYEYTEVFSEQI